MKFGGRTSLPTRKALEISGRTSGRISGQTSEKISERLFQSSPRFSGPSFSRRAMLTPLIVNESEPPPRLGLFLPSPTSRTGEKIEIFETRGPNKDPPKIRKYPPNFRKILVSVKFVSAILGPEMAAPILWTPGKNAFFLQENPCP